MATYAGFGRDAVQWTGRPTQPYRSSTGVVRRFCPSCGSPISYESERWADEIHLLVQCFDQPESLLPTGHVFVGEQLRWLHLADGLPRFATTASDGPALT